MTTNSQSDLPVKRGFLPTWAFSIVCNAALIFVALVVLWLGQTSTRVYSQGADALVIRAVLRMDTDAVQAELLAQRIRQKVPEVTLEIINEAMGRSLLALQEPWIAQMPDFEVTPLPPLIEIKHPDLLTQPESITRFVEELEKEPEVDFVAYNETAHDRLAKLAAATSSIQKHTMKWLLGALMVAGFVAQLHFARASSPRTLPGIAIRHFVTGIAAFTLAVVIFRWWESGAVSAGEWQRLGSGKYFLAGMYSFLIMGICASIKTLQGRFRI